MVVAPNISKEKGRYLIILPEILNIKSQQQQQQEQVDTQEKKSNNNDEDETDKEEKDTKTDTSSKATCDDAPAKKDAKKVPVSLECMEGMSTDSPMLKVPFPGGKTLIFPGKKVEYTSKHIMLSCSTQKKVFRCRAR